ncbi:MAG: LamG domain-containing protein [Candidatus Saccharibacteria bacterium]
MRSSKRSYSITIGLVLCLVLSMFPAAAANAGADTGLIAQYKFAGDCRDASGNGNDGTVVGGVSFADDSVAGKCAVFNGGYITVKSAPGLNLGSQFTISVWVKVDPSMAVPNNKNGSIISKLDDRGIYNNYHFYTRGTFGLRADFRTKGGPGANITNTAFTDLKLSSNWSNLVLSGDGQNLYLYHNGALINTKKMANGESIQTSEGEMRIGTGNDLNNKNLFFKGRMADLRIYSSVLDLNSIKTLYNSGSGMKAQTPTADVKPGTPPATQTQTPQVTAVKLSPARIDSVLVSSRSQFRQLTKIRKLSPVTALAQQIASLKKQPDVDLVEQLPSSTDLKVRFKDGYEVVMLQSAEGIRGSSAIGNNVYAPASIAPDKVSIKSSVQPGSVLPNLNYKMPPQQVSQITRPLDPSQIVSSGVDIEKLNASQLYQTCSPKNYVGLIFDTTADNPYQTPGLDLSIQLSLVQMGYTYYQYVNNDADLKNAARLDEMNLGLVYISTHGTVVDGQFYFTVRPYYNSPPPADSGYVGTKVFYVDNGYGQTKYVYGIGQEFAQTYWTNKFAGTIFLLSACSSAKPSGIYSMPAWTIDNGASAWMGWTDSVSFKNSDKGTLTFLGCMNSWMNVDEARGSVNKVIARPSPDMWGICSASQTSMPTLPHNMWDTGSENYPAGQNFVLFQGEKYDNALYIRICNVLNSPMFRLELDNNGDGKTDVRVKFTSTDYQIYSVAADGKETLKEFGKSMVQNGVYYTAIPWSSLFGSGSIKRYRFIEGEDGGGDAMPNSSWREEPFGISVPIS